MLNPLLKGVFLGLLLTAFNPLQTEAQQTKHDGIAKLTTRLQTRLDQMVRDEDFPGATLAVMLPGDQLISLSSGYSDLATKRKMKPGDRMLSGSTGKTLASAIALQLVGEGKLKLDQLASTYFSSDSDAAWYSKMPNADQITVRSLMNHTSGLPRYLFQPPFLADIKGHPLKSRSPREGLSALHCVKPLHAVGQAWSYSDSNYLLLGLIIEKVSGKTYYELVRQRLIRPLGLAATSPSTQAKLPGLVPGQIGSVNFFELPHKTVADGAYVMNPDFEWCGGGFLTNSRDLAKWLHALHSGKVLNGELHQQLVQPVDQRTGQPADRGYGLGSFIWKTKQGTFYGHSGIMPGYLTQIEYSLEHKFAISLQSNTDQGLGSRHHALVQDIAKMIIESKH